MNRAERRAATRQVRILRRRAQPPPFPLPRPLPPIESSEADALYDTAFLHSRKASLEVFRAFRAQDTSPMHRKANAVAEAAFNRNEARLAAEA